MDNDNDRARSKAELEIAHPKFGEQLVPMYAFYLPTKHSKNASKEAIKARFESVIKDLPAGTQKMAADMLDKKIDAMISKDEQRVEAHILVVAHNTANGLYEGFANSGHKEGNADFKGETPVKIGECEDRGFAIMQAGLTATKMQYGEHWHGKRGTPKEIYADTFSEFMDKLESEGIKTEFLAVYPDTERAVITAAIPSVKKMTKQREKELVKRFGKKNIDALKAKIKTNEGN